MKKSRHFNYVYFGILFIVLAFLHIYHLFLIEKGSAFDRFFYSAYALGQCAIEVGVLMLLAHYFERTFPKKIMTIYIVITFLVFLVHAIDFPLVRIMGMSVWYILGWLGAETAENFLEMLYATHVPIISWILAGLVVLSIPILGIFLYRYTEKISHKRPLYFSSINMVMGLFGLVALISVFDFKGCRDALTGDHALFSHALPWKTTTLYSAPATHLEIRQFPTKPSEAKYLADLDNIEITLKKKPNVFLFVVESLRDDYLTPETTPFLAQFRQENVSFKHGLAAANGTQTSWFSIFHSVYPFYWDNRQLKDWQSGSLPLQILKKAGYQVHVYSASRLTFYQMDQRLFGKEHRLADTFQVFAESEESHQNDTACISALIKDLPKYQQGNVFVVFLESTHFGYSWPTEQSLKPAPKSLEYLNFTCSNETVLGIKSRYQNALHFIDQLFGKFLCALPEDESAIIVTGDHGEEFFEQGRIFHASNLSSMQTHVPIYYRLCNYKGLPLHRQGELSSHLDIFPTILHHVLKEDFFKDWFDGESILREREKKFAVTARYNASRTPFEFLIHDGKNQLIARFSDKDNIVKSRTLEVVSHRDENDAVLDIDLYRLHQTFREPLDQMFK